MSLREFISYMPFVRFFLSRRKSVGPENADSSDGEAVVAGIAFSPRDRRVSIAVDIVSLFLLYLLLAPVVAMPLYNCVIFHPFSSNEKLSAEIKDVEKYFQSKFRDLRVKALDGEGLHAWYFERDGASKVILVSHGNAGCMENRLPLLPLLLQTGCSVFMYDYEGFGSSTGSPSLEKICDDATAAYDYIVQELKVKPENILVYGESIGCGATSVLSTRRKVGAVILQSPFTSLPDAAGDKLIFMKLYPTFAFPEQKLDNLAIMKKEHAPLLLLHGMKDDLLPCSYSKKIMLEAREPKTLVLLPHAGHNDIYATDVDLSVPALNKFVSGL